MAAVTLAALRLTVNGLEVGAGLPVRIVELRGVDDMPEVTADDTPRVYGDGDVPGEDTQRGRVVEADLSCAPNVAADMGVRLRELRGALTNRPGSLVISGLPGLPDVVVRGRVRRSSIPTDRELTFGVARPRFAFYSPDPRLYSATETVLTGRRGVVTTGERVPYNDPTISYSAAIAYSSAETDAAPEAVAVAPPFTPPFTPGGSAVGVSVVARNDGTYDSHPVVQVHGPTGPFSLVQTELGREVRYTASVSAGDYVEFRMADRSVLLNGVASRRNRMEGAWWHLPPGSSTITFLPRAPAPDAFFTVRYADAY